MLFELNALKQINSYNCHQVWFKFLYGEIAILWLVWLTEDSNSSTDRLQNILISKDWTQ